MSQIRIEDLPDIGSNFDPLNDYIIVQRENGQTYKMLLSQLTSGAVAGASKYVDSAEFNISNQAASGSRFTFQKSGLFNYNSSFMLQVGFGDMKTAFVKPPGSNAINGLLGLIPSSRTGEKILSGDKFDVYADIEYNNTANYIRFSNIRYQIVGSIFSFAIIGAGAAAGSMMLGADPEFSMAFINPLFNVIGPAVLASSGAKTIFSAAIQADIAA